MTPSCHPVGVTDWLAAEIGMVGPVTNRTCNEAQIDSPYSSYAEFKRFAAEYTLSHQKQANEIHMLAMFCVGMRRELFQQIGPLDEGFEVGMFEDDDYAQRVHAAGYKLLCVEDRPEERRVGKERGW